MCEPQKSVAGGLPQRRRQLRRSSPFRRGLLATGGLDFVSVVVLWPLWGSPRGCADFNFVGKGALLVLSLRGEDGQLDTAIPSHAHEDDNTPDACNLTGTDLATLDDELYQVNGDASDGFAEGTSVSVSTGSDGSRCLVPLLSPLLHGYLGWAQAWLVASPTRLGLLAAAGIGGKSFLLSGNALFNGKFSVRKSSYFLKKRVKVGGCCRKKSVFGENMYKYHRKIEILGNLLV
jgi:hypothetical protein